jgi:membrane associated rhomboid family serine protease
MGVWIALNLLFGLGGMQLDGSGAEIAWEAHLGGFVSGLLIFGLFDRVPRSEGSTPTYIQ